ncbi:regulatory iron-sulfur-containing complex subunit RicT, partial [Bacteroidota bacterium]
HSIFDQSYIPDICLSCKETSLEEVPVDERNIIEVNCQGLLGHHFCEIEKMNDIHLVKNDLAVTKLDECQDIACVDEVGEIVRARRKRIGLYSEKLPIVLRKADENDLEKYRINLHEEVKARSIFKEKIEKFNLNMKLVDIHYQFDRKRLFFFYTSESRVDFRELAKDLASIFKTRIELRQIGVRDEAKRMGGLGESIVVLLFYTILKKSQLN